MTDWKRCMFFLLMCLTTVCAEDHKVVMKIFLEKDPWLLCNKWERDHFPDNVTSSEYLCTAHNQSSSLQIKCSSQSETTQGKSKYEFLLSGLYLSKSNGPLTSVRVIGTGREEESGLNTQKTPSTLERLYIKTPSEDSTTPSQEYNWLTQASKECTNRSGENCKENCAGGMVVTVIVSFLAGIITGVAILVLLYIYRTKLLCFKTKPKTDIKFAAQTALSNGGAERENAVGSGPVIGKISTEVCQYEDIHSSARQKGGYEVLKYGTVANGGHEVAGNNSVDDYDVIRNSIESTAFSILESDSDTNSHCIKYIHRPESHELVKIGASGFPILTTKLKPIKVSAEDMSISGDATGDESKSRDYFILEATPGARDIDNSMDLCSRKDTSNRPNPARYQLDSQNEAQNSNEQNEAQKNQSNEIISGTERNICTCMNNQTVPNPINTQYETKEKSHESLTPNDPSMEQRDHVYFVLERHDRRQ